GSGDDVERLRTKALAGIAANNIQFTGFVAPEELDALYRSAALFALPSRGEGFGLVYLEAMTHRLPCIGSVHDAAVEVIVDGETGRLVDQNAPEGLAAAISGLLIDVDLRHRMGEAGWQRVTNEFSYERFKDRFLGLLHDDRRAAVSLSA